MPVIGWREWVALPDLGINMVKAKVDTGARSSALHAFDIELYRNRGAQWVRFKVHPRQRDAKKVVDSHAEVVDQRHVRSSGGHQTYRPVILTTIDFFQQSWEIELTLSARDEMGFRMLLGRQGVRGRFWVDPGGSYLDPESPGKRK